MNRSVLSARLASLRRDAATNDEGVAALLRNIREPELLELAGESLASVDAARLVPGGLLKRRACVAIVSSFTPQSAIPVLRTELIKEHIGADLRVFAGPQYAMELADPRSSLAQLEPDLVLVLLHDGALLPTTWSPIDLDGLEATLTERVETLVAQVGAFAERSGVTVVTHTIPLSAVERRSVIGLKEQARLAAIWRRANEVLLGASERYATVYVADLDAALIDGNGPLRDERLAQFAGAAWSLEASVAAVGELARYLRALLVPPRKCLVLDLDNTLWGGILGEDGLANVALGPLYPGSCFRELQRRAKMLELQGVLLAVCSKNDQAAVDEMFAHHPAMILKRDDFVAIRADWQPKDAHLRMLCSELALGAETFVFVDDNRFECELVTQTVPGVTAVHLQGDPARYARQVLEESGFDIPATTAEDRRRTALYRGRAARAVLASSHRTLEEFLRQLDIVVTVERLNEFNAARICQLNDRTNQFNLTKCSLSAEDNDLVLAFSVRDRFGDEGLVGAAGIRRAVDGWCIQNIAMSCRVIGRGVERAMVAQIARLAAKDGVHTLIGSYARTSKNEPAAALYEACGFVPAGGTRERFSGDVAAIIGCTPDWITVTTTAEVLENAS